MYVCAAICEARKCTLNTNIKKWLQELMEKLIQLQTRARQRPQPTQGPEEWCTCGKCRHMENPVERVGCKMRPCITTTYMFHNIALNRNVLAVGILSASDFYGNPVEFAPSNFRKSAYRQYIIFSHGYSGRGNRKVVPSCVLWKVRDNYPAPDNNCMGFKEY